jgi:hypothetical protein
VAGESRTGRLFRSWHADAAAETPEAVIALNLEDAVSLRSISLGDTGSPIDEGPAIDPDFEHLFVAPNARLGDPGIPAANADPDTAEQTPVRDVAAPSERDRPGPTHRNTADTGTPPWAGVISIVAATVLVGIVDVFLTGGIGWLTGGALLISSLYAALTIRPSDGYWIIVTPPLAFLGTVVTVGQATVSGSGFLVRQGLLIPLTLGRNAGWIIAATAAAAIIVSLRRRRLLRS